MKKSIIWLSSAIALTVLVGPLTFVASQAGRTDTADLYLVFEVSAKSASDTALQAYGARDIGPQRGLLGRMVHAPDGSRDRLLNAGYIMLPAGSLAALCGANADNSTFLRSS